MKLIWTLWFVVSLLAVLGTAKLAPIMTQEQMEAGWRRGRLPLGSTSQDDFKVGGGEQDEPEAKLKARSVDEEPLPSEYVEFEQIEPGIPPSYRNLARSHPSDMDYFGYSRQLSLQHAMTETAEYVAGSRAFMLGKTVEERPLPCWRSREGPPPSDGRPRLFIGAGMDGIGAGPREALKQFALRVGIQYQKGNPKVRDLLDSVDLVICPALNPDGFEHGNMSNANGYFLHRNWPTRIENSVVEGLEEQPETTALREEWTKRPPSAALLLYGGEWAVVYPWDDAGGASGDYGVPPEERLLQDVAKATAAVPVMQEHSRFPEGTNGQSWFRVPRSPIDWLTHEVETCAISVEAGPAWPNIYDLMQGQVSPIFSVIGAWIQRVRVSVGGIVLDSTTNAPIAGATATARPISSNGEVLRARTGIDGSWNTPAFEGQDYAVTVSAPGYETRPAYSTKYGKAPERVFLRKL